METNLQDERPQPKAVANPSVPLEELQYHFEGLRSLFLFALVALIGMTVTVDLCFIRRQMVYAQNQLEDQRPKVSEKVATYKKRLEPLVKNFTVSMQNFAASNQDFQPIFNRYRLVLGPYMVPASGGAAPAAPAKTPQVPPK